MRAFTSRRNSMSNSIFRVPCRVVALITVSLILFLAACAEPADDADTASPPAPAAAFTVLTPALVAQATALREKALGDDRAWTFLEGLTVEVGPRFAGSPGDPRAVAWAVAALESMGLENVRAEPVTVPRWDRGSASGRLVSPFPQPVVLAALGGSVATPAGGLEAEVLRVESMDELGALGARYAEGKIVFIDEVMERTRDGSGYGTAVAKRGGGASLAAERGAIALLIRSAGTSTSRIAHTGGMRYRDDVRKIPAAALSNIDATLLAAQITRGEPVRFYLELNTRDLGTAASANVIGEVVGREFPDQVIVLAAHLDSWDLGTGAIDDGAGCAIVSAAAKLIAEMPERPRRTIRVLLAANEEFGLSGARAYGEKYADAMDQHVAGIEADFGAGRVWALRSRVQDDRLPWIADAVQLLAPLGIEYQGNEARGGADLRPLRQANVPVFDLAQDGSAYFDVHHTMEDTLDKVDPEALRQNVAAHAILAYVLAEQEGDLGRSPE